MRSCCSPESEDSGNAEKYSEWGGAREVCNGKCLLMCAIHPVLKDPEHENWLLEGRTGFISKLKTARQLGMTQASGGAIPGNWFVSSGIFISPFGSPVPALGLEPAQLSPWWSWGGGGTDSLLLMGWQEAHHWAEPGGADGSYEHQAVHLVSLSTYSGLGDGHRPYWGRQQRRSDFPACTAQSRVDILSDVST